MSDFETDLIEHVLYVNAAPNGKAFTIAVRTKTGRQLAFGIPAEEASKIVDGITQTSLTVSAGLKAGVAAKVDAVDLDADALGQAVLLTLRAGQAPLGRFAIPPDLAEKMGPGLQMKAGEVLKKAADITKAQN
jgi:hypothetical protein